MVAETAQAIKELEAMIEKIAKLKTYISETSDPEALKLATEIIAQGRIPCEISSGRQAILSGYVPFQCNGSCPKLYPNTRVLVLKAYAEGLENADLGYIIRNP